MYVLFFADAGTQMAGVEGGILKGFPLQASLSFFLPLYMNSALHSKGHVKCKQKAKDRTQTVAGCQHSMQHPYQ